MEIYITYDAHNGKSDIKPALLKVGFHDHWVFENKTYNLPDTSLWIQDCISTSKAQQIFDQVIAQLNLKRTTFDKIKIERFIAIPLTSFSGIEGKKHS